MTLRFLSSSVLLTASALLTASVLLFGRPLLAAPAPRPISLTPPLASAKTIQVTETVWEAKDGPTPGPLHKAGVWTYSIERPSKFRVEMKQILPGHPESLCVSDGTTLSGSEGGQVRSQPTDRAEWPFPMMGLLNNAPGPVSAVPTIRGGRQVLLALRSSPPGRQEFWFDPKTHLLIQDRMFLTWQGKTTEVMRAEYTGWVLNKPIPDSVFRVPAAGHGHK